MSPAFKGIGMTSQRTRNRLVERLRSHGIRDETVLEAIGTTPRHIFVDEALASRAYEDTALPIGYGQTISQPYVVARMTEALLAGGRPERVLEVGTGSGYQTAILACLSDAVFSVERLRVLLHQARERMFALKLHNVRLNYSDGNWGWPEHAPFDGIIVTAAPTRVPEELYRQLKPGGRMVIPVGESGAQRLLMIEAAEDGPRETQLDLVSFVPMIGGMG